MPAWNIHDFGLGNIECHYWCAPSSGLYKGSVDADAVDIILRRRRRTPRRSNPWVRAWQTKADCRWMVTTRYHTCRLMPDLRYADSYFNYLRMQTKRRQRIESSVNTQCTRSVRAVTTRWTQWKRHGSAGNHQLIRRKNAMELHRNTKVAVRTSWHRHLQI